MKERRQYKRYNTNLKAKCIYYSKAIKTAKKEALIKDTSHDGVKLAIRDSIEKGTYFLLEFLSGGLNLPVIATGKVIWHKQGECGIKFDWVSGRQKYEHYLSSLS
ncbi:MAG: PilZ domain-containing protein [Candidatus Omnitrophota bacterium]